MKGGWKIARESGAALFEFAIVAPLLFFVLLGGIEIASASYQASALQFSMARAMRQGILNSSWGGGTREDYIKNTIIQIAGNYNLTLTQSDIKICSATTGAAVSTNCPTESAGSGNSFVAIKVTKEVASLFRTIGYELTTTVVGRNEPT